MSEAILIATASTPLIDLVIRNELLGFIIPLLLLFITIIMFAVDFGVVGIGTLSSVFLVVGWWLGFIPVHIISLISFILIISIVMFKVTR